MKRLAATVLGPLLLVFGASAFASVDRNMLAGYYEKLDAIESTITNRQSIVFRQPDSWVHLESLASAYLERAKLTGNFDDYEQVDQILQQAFSLAGPGAGPFLLQSQLDFTIHRFEEASENLLALEKSLLKDRQLLLHIQSMRADIDLYSGRYESAKQAYQALENEQPTVESAVRLALYYSTTGRFNQSEQWLNKAQSRSTSDTHIQSWLALQHGIVDLSQGRLNEALKHYREGLVIFPGYWLIEEHIAEVDALKGRHQAAESSYRELIERTQSPLFMTALADLLAERQSQNEQEEARHWYKRAHSVYQYRLNRLPEVVAGHAVGFFLDTADPDVTMSLAENNYHLRPGGEAATQLIQAYINSGDTDKAVPLLQHTLHSDYVSADLYNTASMLYQQLNQEHKAKRYMTLAQTINPLVAD